MPQLITLMLEEGRLVEIVVAISHRLAHGIEKLIDETTLIELLTNLQPHRHNLVIGTNDDVLALLANGGLAIPCPQIKRSVDFLHHIRFVVGDGVEHRILVQPHLGVEPNVLILEELKPVRFAVDEHLVTVTPEHSPAAVNRLLLDEHGVQEVEPLLDRTQHKVQTVVVEESVIAIAEHDVLAIAMVDAVVASIRDTSVRLDNIVYSVRIFGEIRSIQYHLIAVIDHQHFEIVIVHAVLAFDGVEQKLASFPRLLVVRDYDS